MKKCKNAKNHKFLNYKNKLKAYEVKIIKTSFFYE